MQEKRILARVFFAGKDVEDPVAGGFDFQKSVVVDDATQYGGFRLGVALSSFLGSRHSAALLGPGVRSFFQR